MSLWRRQRDTTPNPRSKKQVNGDPVWMMNLALLMRVVNIGMATLIVVGLITLGTLQI